MNREEIEQIKKQTNIVRVIGSLVELKKTGKTYFANCPFHDDRTPSFNVHPTEKYFYCFGCGVGGDVIKFVMKHQGIKFKEAIELIKGMG